MSDEKVLTKEIAEQFLAYDDSVDLDDFTTIEDTAAESLSKHERSLELNSLTELSNAAAESLSKHKGRLSLDGLTSLSRGGDCLETRPQAEVQSRYRRIRR